jgi:hypothetical protein
VATAVGSAAAAAAGEGVGGAVVGMLVFFLVNHGLVGVAVRRRRRAGCCRSCCPAPAVGRCHTPATASIGLLAPTWP